MQLPDTNAARSRILGALRGAAPVAALPAPDLSPFFAGPFGRGCLGERPDPADLIEGFVNAARGWRADVVPASVTTWPQVLRQALAQRGCTRIAIGAASPLQPALDGALAGLTVRHFDRPIEDWKHELFDQIDAGVTTCVAGIADTGSLLLRPGPDEPRTLSLVPPVHAVVVMASTLHASLPAAWRALQVDADLPTNLLLVTGPSKTADIQQVLAYGAHGPKELVIVLVDDLAAVQEVQP